MRTMPIRRRLALGTLALLAASSVSAADIYKADNSLPLSQPASWIGNVAPGATDFAVWGSTVTAANSSSTLDVSSSYGGIKILNPSPPPPLWQVSIGGTKNLTLNGVAGVGIDMSNATWDLVISVPVTLANSQTWTVTNGRNVTINGAISGPGGIVKTGSGTVILNGNLSYSGATIVNAGKLVLPSTDYSSGSITVADGAELGLRVINLGEQVMPDSLILGSSNVTTLDFDFGALPNPPAAPFSVGVMLTVKGTNVISIAGTGLTPGQFSLIEFGARSGGGSFKLGTLPAGVCGALVTNLQTSSLDLSLNVLNSIGPSNLTVCPGGAAFFSTTPSGCGSYTYSWSKNGSIMPGQTNSWLYISPATVSDAGTYCVAISDGCGCHRTNCASLFVGDSQPPVITCPPDRTVFTSSNGSPVYFTVTATDNCSGSVNVVCTPPSGSYFLLGSTVVNCVAYDASSNAAPCSFKVNVLPLSSCCQNKTWQFLDVSAPPARLGHAMAYDSLRKRVVLFGGSGSSSLLGDTWEWDGAIWVRMATNGPSPRAFSAMAYDNRLGRTILFGGMTVSNISAETWGWDGANWTILTAAGPGARLRHAMAYDSDRGRTVLFGGLADTGFEQADTWEFNGTAWLNTSSTNNPAPRQGHAMAFDRMMGYTLLFGGLKPGALFGDTWRWDGVNWTLITTNGPSPRAYHAMAYNDNCGVAVLFGGGTSTNSPLTDTWEWDGTAWSLKATNSPPARAQHAMAHDSLHNQTILFGGSPGFQTRYNDTWAYEPDPNGPQSLSAFAFCGDQRVTVAFNKPVDPVSAQNPANYFLACGGALSVTQAVLSADPRILILQVAQPVSGSCLLTISGIYDLCGHGMKTAQQPLQCPTNACARGSAGTEFWLTFPGNYAPDATNPPQPQFFITGPVGAFGTVSMPGLPTPFSASFTIPGSGEITVPLPRDADLGNANDVILNSGINVIANAPVSVYGLNHIPYTTDGYLGLCTRGIGQTYVVWPTRIPSPMRRN